MFEPRIRKQVLSCFTKKKHSVLPPIPSISDCQGKKYLSGSQLLLDDKRFTSDATVNVVDIVGCCFEMTCSIITLGNITMVFGSIFKGHKQIRDRNKSEA
jgi:hypothetical protein